MPGAVLETPRLRLEAIEPRHADALWVATESSLPELRPWMPWTVGATLSETRSFAAGAAAEWRENRGWTFAILFDDDPVGTVGLNRYLPLLQSANLGYWLRTDLAGRGLMTEAASAVVEFAFGQIELHRLEVQASPDNLPSRRVAQKLGFRREGLVRDGGRGADGFYDVEVYGLLDDDERKRFH